MISGFLLLVVLLGPLVGALFGLTLQGTARIGRAVTSAGALAAAAALGLMVIAGAESTGTIQAIDWAEITLTRIGALLLFIVMGTATVVAGFSSRSLDDDGRASRYFGLIGVVASASAMVVVTGPPVLLFIGWVAAGWALVGLVGFEGSWKLAIHAQRRVLLTLTVGDVSLAAALVISAVNSDGLLTGNGVALEQLRSSSVLGVESLHIVMLLVVIAGASRSAMFPFHRWLLATLAAPTPVSALVHAGLVSGAGLLLIRFASPFVASDPAVIAAFVLGMLTAIIASAATLIRSDAKGSLVWSTVAQMAFMVVQCAVGAFSSAIFHIAGHGMYKASLFLGVGDNVSEGLRSQRRAAPIAEFSTTTRLTLSTLVASIVVASIGWMLPPDVGDAGQVLVYVFAWLTVASGMNGWLKRCPFAPVVTLATGVGGAVVSAFLYLGGLRIAEAFVKPALVDVPVDTAIGSTVLIVVLATSGVLVGAVAFLPGPTGAQIRDHARRLIVRLTEPRMRLRAPQSAVTGLASVETPPTSRDFRSKRGEIRADVSRASEIIAPQWPLSSFVAVNPLSGLESLSFDDAARQARHWLGAKTHMDLADYRRAQAVGQIHMEHLRAAVHSRISTLSESPSIVVGGQNLAPLDIAVADLLHSPEPRDTQSAHTAVERCDGEHEAITGAINEVLSSWVASYVSPPHWPLHRPGESFVAMALRVLDSDPRVHSFMTGPVRDWVRGLTDDAASMIGASFVVSGVPEADRIDEARGHLCHLPGWAGLAKWRNEWAQPDERRPALSPIDLVAVRALLEACAIGSGTIAGPPQPRNRVADETSELSDRVDAVMAALAPSGDEQDRTAIANVLMEVSSESLPSMWLDAQERTTDSHMLRMLDRTAPEEPIARPDAQLVFCIDVRSEGLRRHLETLGNVETIGFAGFFGVPMRVRRLGWAHYEPRCPVLVSPVIAATEQARKDDIAFAASQLSRQRSTSAVLSAHSGAKYGPGAPFALAETAGWLLGPHAAARTFIPQRSTEPVPPPTHMMLDDDEVLLEQRIFFAESVLNTMGLTEGFAPVVALCGHTSHTTNNPHATALECGACAGASGDDNARAVASLLNSLDVRHGLHERGISIPDETWFVAGLHDTASDRVRFLDLADIPATHQQSIAELKTLLDEAGRHQAAARAAHLPGPDARVRDRGADWAQVRPEWGLARNAAFIIAPRSLTAGLDLDGRAFLHSYDADDDPSGRVLETIMTAPLVVGHWISAQYYFSTVDSERFGAGNKLLHNPIGTTGVISGDRGDIRIGLPLQSTHVDGKAFHQPVRLLAVIQADLEQVDTIIANNPILRTLTSGSWLRIAARSQPDQPWFTRTSAGAWLETARDFDTDAILIPNTETP